MNTYSFPTNPENGGRPDQRKEEHRRAQPPSRTRARQAARKIPSIVSSPDRMPPRRRARTRNAPRFIAAVRRRRRTRSPSPSSLKTPSFCREHRSGDARCSSRPRSRFRFVCPSALRLPRGGRRGDRDHPAEVRPRRLRLGTLAPSPRRPKPSRKNRMSTAKPFGLRPDRAERTPPASAPPRTRREPTCGTGRRRSCTRSRRARTPTPITNRVRQVRLLAASCASDLLGDVRRAPANWAEAVEPARTVEHHPGGDARRRRRTSASAASCASPCPPGRNPTRTNDTTLTISIAR